MLSVVVADVEVVLAVVGLVDGSGHDGGCIGVEGVIVVGRRFRRGRRGSSGCVVAMVVM